MTFVVWKNCVWISLDEIMHTITSWCLKQVRSRTCAPSAGRRSLRAAAGTSTWRRDTAGKPVTLLIHVTRLLYMCMFSICAADVCQYAVRNCVTLSTVYGGRVCVWLTGEALTHSSLLEADGGSSDSMVNMNLHHAMLRTQGRNRTPRRWASVIVSRNGTNGVSSRFRSGGSGRGSDSASWPGHHDDSARIQRWCGGAVVVIVFVNKLF